MRLFILISIAALACLSLTGCDQDGQAKPTVSAETKEREPAPATQPAPDAPLPLPLTLPARHTICGGHRPIVGEPNMGPPRKDKRPPFLAPRGTVNLARGKKVTSSDPEPIIGELKFINDGDKQSSDGCFVELALGRQWVMIDLQAEARIHAIVVWHHWREHRAYRDVVVQVDTNSDFGRCTMLFNNDHDNSSNLGKGVDKVYFEDYQGKLIDCKGVRGRYVRLWSKENTSDESNHYVEVEVYGKWVE